MTLKIILVGIMTLVPNKPWEENPTEVMVLLNSGGAGGHAVQHDALLFVDPKNVKSVFLPDSTIAEIAERECSDKPGVTMEPMQAVVNIGGEELTFEEGSSVVSPGVKFEALTCDNFMVANSTVKGFQYLLEAPCLKEHTEVPKRYVANDIRWLLNTDVLGGRHLPVAGELYGARVAETARPLLAARLKLTSGLLETRTLSGGARVVDGRLQGPIRSWVFRLPGETPPAGEVPVTVAGTLALSIEYSAPSAAVFQRGLSNPSGEPSRLLTLYSPDGQPVGIRIENTPLSHLMSSHSCDPVSQVDLMSHAELIYNLLDGGTGFRGWWTGRKLPYAVSSGEGGVRDVNRPRCEPATWASRKPGKKQGGRLEQ